MEGKEGGMGLDGTGRAEEGRAEESGRGEVEKVERRKRTEGGKGRGRSRSGQQGTRASKQQHCRMKSCEC